MVPISAEVSQLMTTVPDSSYAPNAETTASVRGRNGL